MKLRIFRFLFWLLLLLLTGAAAFCSDAVLAKTAFLFVLLIVPVSLLLVLPLRRTLSITIALPVTAAKNKPLTGTVTLLNQGRLACRCADVSLLVKNLFTGEFSYISVPLSAPARGSASSMVAFSSAHCGQLRFSVEEVRLRDWFGIFSIHAFAENADGSAVIILPDTFPSDLSVLLPLSDQAEDDSSDSRRGTEDPSEIRSFRDYVPGDPLKMVHWKLSAKREELVLKEAARPLSRTLLLFFDKSLPAGSVSPHDSNGDGAHDTLAESAVSAGAVPDALAESIASAALSLTSQGVVFTLGWTDPDDTKMIPITSEDDVFAAIPLMLQNGGSLHGASLELPGLSGLSGVPGISDFQGVPADAGSFAKAFLFAGQYPFGAESFFPRDTVCFLCEQTERQEAGHIPDPDILSDRQEILYTIRFSPEEVAEVFSMLTV